MKERRLNSIAEAASDALLPVSNIDVHALVPSELGLPAGMDAPLPFRSDGGVSSMKDALIN